MTTKKQQERIDRAERRADLGSGAALAAARLTKSFHGRYSLPMDNGPAQSALKSAGESLKDAAREIGRNRTARAIDGVIDAMSSIESALDDLEVVSGVSHDSGRSFLTLRSDLRMFKHEIEDSVVEARAARSLADEVLEDYDEMGPGGDCVCSKCGATDEQAVEDLMTDLMSRGVIASMGPTGNPTRKEGIYVARAPADAVGEIGPRAVDVRLVSGGRWAENRIVDAAEYLEALRGVPNERDPDTIWSIAPSS